MPVSKVACWEEDEEAGVRIGNYLADSRVRRRRLLYSPSIVSRLYRIVVGGRRRRGTVVVVVGRGGGGGGGGGGGSELVSGIRVVPTTYRPDGSDGGGGGANEMTGISLLLPTHRLRLFFTRTLHTIFSPPYKFSYYSMFFLGRSFSGRQSSSDRQTSLSHSLFLKHSPQCVRHPQ